MDRVCSSAYLYIFVQCSILFFGGIDSIQAQTKSSQVVDLEMVLIPAGEFIMGSPADEKDRFDNEGPQHKVVISKPFYLGKYEITQEQWETVMGYNPSEFKGKRRPVENVSWNDCQRFIKQLNKLGQGTFRLPTEAEWEYACRAGKQTRFYWGDDPNEKEIDDYAWFHGNSEKKTHDVGLKKPNAWGLYDMSGNVHEWCQDSYDENYYSISTSIDPVNDQSNEWRVLRGGNWYYGARYCRSAFRSRSNPYDAYDNVGFRVTRTP